jgi:hypothetical protein
MRAIEEDMMVHRVATVNAFSKWMMFGFAIPAATRADLH